MRSAFDQIRFLGVVLFFGKNIAAVVKICVVLAVGFVVVAVAVVVVVVVGCRWRCAF